MCGIKIEPLVSASEMSSSGIPPKSLLKEPMRLEGGWRDPLALIYLPSQRGKGGRGAHQLNVAAVVIGQLERVAILSAPCQPAIVARARKEGVAAGDIAVLSADRHGRRVAALLHSLAVLDIVEVELRLPGDAGPVAQRLRHEVIPRHGEPDEG